MIPPAQRCGRRLRRLLEPLAAAAGAVPGADRYRKACPAAAHLRLLAFHALDGADSLRQTHAKLAGTPGGFAAVGLPGGVSRSQLARSSTSRPAACAERLLADLIGRARRNVRRRAAADPALARLLRVQAVDGTFLTLSAKLAPWSRHGGHAPGVRLHVGLDLAGAVPAHLRWTLADTHDARGLDERDLAELAGWTLLMDLGYYGHRRFVRLRAAGVSFVCPLHAQAAYRVTTAHPVPAGPAPGGDVVVADEEMTLGSPNNRDGAVLPGLRLVTGRNPAGEIRRFVTDRWDLSAADVLALYRQRWQIELFFRWLKHQLTLLRPLGTSPEAVWLTVLVAAIAAVLALLAEPDRPLGDSRIQWLRAVGAALHAADPAPG
jgi:hypothetical protein